MTPTYGRVTRIYFLKITFPVSFLFSDSDRLLKFTLSGQHVFQNVRFIKKRAFQDRKNWQCILHQASLMTSQKNKTDVATIHSEICIYPKLSAMPLYCPKMNTNIKSVKFWRAPTLRSHHDVMGWMIFVWLPFKYETIIPWQVLKFLFPCLYWLRRYAKKCECGGLKSPPPVPGVSQQAEIHYTEDNYVQTSHDSARNSEMYTCLYVKMNLKWPDRLDADEADWRTHLLPFSGECRRGTQVQEHTEVCETKLIVSGVWWDTCVIMLPEGKPTLSLFVWRGS